MARKARIDMTTALLPPAMFGLIALAIFTAVLMVGIEIVGGIDRLRIVVARAGPWAPVVYVGVKAATYFVPPLSGGPLNVFAGTLFGLHNGLVYALLGDLVGGSVNYWLARILGRPVITRIAGETGVARVDQFAHQFGDWRGLLLARILLAGIYDLASYAAGVTLLPFKHYLIVTVIGGFIPTAPLVALGAGFLGEREAILLGYGVMVVSFLVAMTILRHLRNIRHSSKDE